MGELGERVRTAFAAQYGGPPTFMVRAPGRVNLLGEHTDYNQGFVFPAAIDRDVVIAARPRPDRGVRLVALDLAAEDAFELASFERLAVGPTWSNYLRGVLRMLQEAGHELGGFEAVFAGEVPQGAGLSSSAALEVATLTLMIALHGLTIPSVDRALLAQAAENRFVGVQCGIMDQFISVLGQPDSALLIDCRDLSYRAVRLDLEARGLAIAIVDSGVQRGLVDSAFNSRREECAAAVHLLAPLLRRELTSLRDVSPFEFNGVAAELPPDLRARARHVIAENERVVRGVEALEAGELAVFGKLMNDSHRSLQHEYRVSVPELDLLVALARKVPGVLGARMTGAGFGGCIVSLVPVASLPAFRIQVLANYEERTGRRATLHVCRAVAGAGPLEL